MSQFGVILALIFSLIIAIFAIANNQPIEVNYLYGKAEVSAIVVILGAAILGALVIFLLSMFRQIRFSFQIRNLRSEIELYKNRAFELEKERERLSAQVEQFSYLSAGGQDVVTEKDETTSTVATVEFQETKQPMEGDTGPDRGGDDEERQPETKEAFTEKDPDPAEDPGQVEDQVEEDEQKT